MRPPGLPMTSGIGEDRKYNPAPEHRLPGARDDPGLPLTGEAVLGALCLPHPPSSLTHTIRGRSGNDSMPSLPEERPHPRQGPFPDAFGGADQGRNLPGLLGRLAPAPDSSHQSLRPGSQGSEGPHLPLRANRDGVAEGRGWGVGGYLPEGHHRVLTKAQFGKSELRPPRVRAGRWGDGASSRSISAIRSPRGFARAGGGTGSPARSSEGGPAVQAAGPGRLSPAAPLGWTQGLPPGLPWE